MPPVMNVQHLRTPPTEPAAAPPLQTVTTSSGSSGVSDAHGQAEPGLRSVRRVNQPPLFQSPAVAMLWWKRQRKLPRRRQGEADIHCSPPASDSEDSSGSEVEPVFCPTVRPHPLAEAAARRPATATSRRAEAPAEQQRRPRSAAQVRPRIQPLWRSQRRAIPEAPPKDIRDLAAELTVIAQLLVPSQLFQVAELPSRFSLRHFDLRWLVPPRLLRGPGERARRVPVFRARRPEAMRNLSSMPEDHLYRLLECDAAAGPPGRWHPPSASTREAAVLNSPRSAVVLLRMGCSVEDLQRQPEAQEVGLPDAIRARQRDEADAERRALLVQCRDAYCSICEAVPLSEVTAFYEDLWNTRLGPELARDHRSAELTASSVIGAPRGSVSPPAVHLGPSGAARRLHDTAKAAKLLGTTRDTNDELWEHAAHPQSERHRRRVMTMLQRQHRDLRNKRVRLAQLDARRRQALAARQLGRQLAWQLRCDEHAALRRARRRRQEAAENCDAMRRCSVLDRLQDVSDLGERVQRIQRKTAEASRRRNVTMPDALSYASDVLGAADAAARRDLSQMVAAVRYKSSFESVTLPDKRGPLV